MSVAVKCQRNYDRASLKRIIESCGCCPPMGPQCPSTCIVPSPTQPKRRSSHSRRAANNLRESNCCPPSTPATCMTCPPYPPIPPCPPCPFVCPPCTGYPCITCAPLPKPVPAPFEYGPVVRTPINSGGLFYTATNRCNPCVPPTCLPRCLPYTSIPGMSVTC